MHLVDANVLIEAKNRYYAFDIAPGFCAWLEQGHRTGKLISIEQPSPQAQKRVKIPDACAAMGVATADIFTVLRKTGAALHLGDSVEREPHAEQRELTIPGLD